jgi:hypothetical protein
MRMRGKQVYGLGEVEAQIQQVEVGWCACFPDLGGGRPEAGRDGLAMITL